MAVNEDVYSPQNNTVWLHDAKNDTVNIFYGVLQEAFVAFTVNKTPYITSRFEQHTINSSPQTYLKTEWQTQQQSTDLTWADAPFWLKPRYKENRWYVSIPRAKAVFDDNQTYMVNSNLVGQFLKVKLSIKTSKLFWLKDVLTKFVKSNI
jgi:hypothetical protein